MGSNSQVKAAFIGIALAAGAAAFAQVLSPGETRVNTAFSSMRSEASIWLRLTGTDTIGSTTANLLSDTFWTSGFDSFGQPFGKLECVETRNGMLEWRTVGDATTLWSYNALKNQYNATTYGTLSGGAQPTSYMQTLLQGFATHSKGTTIHIGRFLREVYAGGFALFRPWLIGSQERILIGGMTMQDPVLGSTRTYTSTPTTAFVVFWVGNPATRSLAFELDDDPSSTGVPIRNIFYADASQVGGSARLLEWRMAVQRNAPSTGNFLFIPPTSSRAVVRTGGGLN